MAAAGGEAAEGTAQSELRVPRQASLALVLAPTPAELDEFDACCGGGGEGGAEAEGAEAEGAEAEGAEADGARGELCVEWRLLSALPSLCVSCGSGGGGEADGGPLLVCRCCGESYHRFCLGLNADAVIDDATWQCPECVACHGCGGRRDARPLLLCGCGNAYHMQCCRPALTLPPQGVWKCPKCVKCERCGTTKPGRGGWRIDCRFCDPCAKIHEEKGYCPVCRNDCRTEEGAMLCWLARG